MGCWSLTSQSSGRTACIDLGAEKLGVWRQSLLTLWSRTHQSSCSFFILIHRCFNGGRYSPERLQGGTVIHCKGVGYTDEDLSEAAPFRLSQPSTSCIHADQDGSVWVSMRQKLHNAPDSPHNGAIYAKQLLFIYSIYFTLV